MKCQKLLEQENGILLLQLIKELLQFYKMDYSLSIFSSEANIREDISKENLLDKINLKGKENKE